MYNFYTYGLYETHSYIAPFINVCSNLIEIFSNTIRLKLKVWKRMESQLIMSGVILTEIVNIIANAEILKAIFKVCLLCRRGCNKSFILCKEHLRIIVIRLSNIFASSFRNFE